MAAGTYSFKGTADMSQHNEQIKKAKKEVTKYKDEVINAQKETDRLSKPNFSGAYNSQKKLQNTVKTTTNVMNGLSGNLMGAIGKFGPYAAAAVAAFKLVEAAINKARSVNETFNDQIGKLSAQLNGSFDELANRISRMDFSNLLSGLATAAKYAGQIYDAMDKAGTFKMVSNPAIGEAQNEITRLRIQVQELKVKQQQLKKEKKDYSDIEAQITQLNKLIEQQLQKLKDIYVQQMKNAYNTAGSVANYALGGAEAVGNLYKQNGVTAMNMRAMLDIMAKNDWAANVRNGVTGTGGLNAGNMLNFIANDIGSPLLTQTQNFFKQALEAWGSGNKSLADQMTMKAFGGDVKATEMADSMNALYAWYAGVKSRLTEGTDGNLKKYTDALNEANAAYAAYLSAQQQHVGDKSAQVRVQWTPVGGSGAGSKGPDWQVGSIAEIDDMIKKLQDRLKNEKFDLNTQIDINKQIEELENQKAMLELQVAIGGNTDLTSAFGGLLDGVLQAGTVEDFCSNMVDLIDNYFASQPEFQLPAVVFPSAEMEESAREAMKNIEQIIEEEYVKICEEIRQQNKEMADTFDSLGTIFSSIGSTMEGAAGDMMSAFGSILGTIGTVIAKLVALAEANGVASAMELPWPANLAAVATVISGLMSAIAAIDAASSKKYAGGGIFDGSGPKIGDMHIARVNPGEMILNDRQQANLFRLLNGNVGPQTGGNNGGHVDFRISGTELVGVLSNNDKQRRRVC